MDFNWSILRREERISLKLRELYESFSYKKFSMNKFEEYSFYMKNKNFLQSEQFITFSDTDGKLMALKPDITLSIVKNTRATEETSERIYYTENVYRISRKSGSFSEIKQTGVELIGKLSLYKKFEVSLLALKSLNIISNSFMLDFSSMKYILGALSEGNFDYQTKKRIFECLESKNVHDLEILLKDIEADEKTCKLICELCTLSGPFEKTISKAEKLSCNKEMEEAIEELKSLWEGLRETEFSDKIRLDFSITSDTDYYNGILFRGYVEGVSSACLVGGQYDNLLSRMGKKKLEAMGFAVNFDELQRFLKSVDEKEDREVVVSAAKGSLSEVYKSINDALSQGKKIVVDSKEN